MKLVFAIVLLALMGCASNKPVVEQETATRGNLRCEELNDVLEEFRESLKISNSKVYIAPDSEEECFCVETVICNNVEYCYKNKCPDGRLVTWFGKNF